jgi:hypothetical protein
MFRLSTRLDQDALPRSFPCRIDPTSLTHADGTMVGIGVGGSARNVAALTARMEALSGHDDMPELQV